MQVSENDIADFMAGLSRGSKDRLVAAAIECDAEIAAQATMGNPSEFEVSLKSAYRTIQQVTQKNMDEIPPGTELESNEEIARIQANLRLQAAQRKSTAYRPESTYRPTLRPPTLVLVVCDDGSAAGEMIRIRTDRFIIGRSEGDLQFPLDEMISSRHLAITLQQVQGKSRWVVTDLQSKNGLFVRVAKGPLANRSEVLIGGGRYRLELAADDAASTVGFAGGIEASSTRAFQGTASIGSTVFSEILATGIGSRYVLNAEQYWIGSHDSCEIRRPSDPFTAAKHARLVCSERGNWSIQNNGSANGVWLRMPQIVLASGKRCEFQIGEQRFRLGLGVEP